ncbi:hypothetical protein [Salinicoccus sp. RF5]|uniref:hypothetical protein n=1 Tax=Salinicoccus sp. RF5 TaxID=2748874 RepID=UPI001E368429|nr:hypothetical protein [Salinicoccus sp. RF5]MCC4721847.1 hypothetical protein [Salinicoccus sp. RF5]
MNNLFDQESQVKNIRKSRLYMVLGIVGGMLLGSLVVYFIQGRFPIEVMAGATLAGFLLLLFEFFIARHEKSDLPETDERISHNIFVFMSILSQAALAILVLGLSVFSLFGEESISIIYLWIFFLIYILVGSIGGIIVKNR